MNFRDVLIAAAVVLLWGLTFFFMRQGLKEMTPLVLGMMRFLLVAFPAVFFVRKPDVPWRWLLLYGLAISFGQFSLMFTALAVGMPTGLTALVLQSQVFFSVLMAALIWREPVKLNHWLALLVAFLGMVLIGIGQHSGAIPFLGLLLVLGAAFSWACGNLVVKRIGRVNPVALVVWGNVVAWLPFALCASLQSGVGGVLRQVAGLDLSAWLALVYLSYLGTLGGYGAWGSLLSRHPVGKIAPLSLLVPVVALLVAHFFLRESLNSWQWAGVVVVMAALVVQVFGGLWIKSGTAFQKNT